jgi:ABC-2 type transport system permease protein/lipopolysaccharide transport system permease protein
MAIVSSHPPGSLLSHLRLGLSRSFISKASGDLADGWKARTLWGTMAYQDIRQRYRRSMLGPFWITISMGVMVGALGILYGSIFKQELGTYLPYLASGFVVWGLMAGLIGGSARAFMDNEGMIRQLPAPLSIYVYRMVWSNFIESAHNILIFVVVALIFDVTLSWQMLAALPGVALILLNGVWVGLLLGLVSARFRDIPMIVGSIVQLAFFMTPVMWKPDMLPGRTLLLDANPFYHFLEIVRAPLLGHLPLLENWVVALVITVVGWAVTFLFFSAFRWRLAYWV